MEDGSYEISIMGIDKAANSITQQVMFVVDHTILDKPQIVEFQEFDPILILIIVGIAVAIIIAVAFSQKKQKIVNNQ